ncbi:MAG: hypothetical protein CL764_05995 [Chloroflexi bacterium]|nr:hypothetical protein [Chloroflexota bacterium]|tara:strand:+ start:193 stop:1044 length:852 start_codon:yes stop_codon:yes gene_type:complete
MKNKENNKIVFLGTGSSDGIPRVSCLTKTNDICETCVSSIKPNSLNRRRNTSLLIQNTFHNEIHNTVIDIGKTFWEGAIQLFPKHNVRKLDGVIITHSHADAVGGLDHLRDWTNWIQDQVKIFIRKEDLERVKKMFFYIFDNNPPSRYAIPQLNFELIDKNSLFSINSISYKPIPVFHGNNYISFGYKFLNIAYIPDISGIPKESEKLFEDLDILIIDALRPQGSHRSHFTLEQSLKVVRKYKPKKTFLTDITCNIEHHRINEYLQNFNLDVELAYDGLSIEV